MRQRGRESKSLHGDDMRQRGRESKSLHGDDMRDREGEKVRACTEMT